MEVYSGKIPWVKAVLENRKQVSENLLSLRFKIPEGEWIHHVPGQHYDVRLIAPDNYIAERSYSIANVPHEKGIIELGVQLLPDGEVSPFLWTIQPGTVIEMRGPIGGHFVWDVGRSSNLVLIGGGSGVVPLMSMLRHYIYEKENAAVGALTAQKIFLIISAKSEALTPYREELLQYMSRQDIQITVTLTDKVSENWKGFTGRISPEMISKILGSQPLEDVLIFVCGRNGFVDTAASALKQLGYSREVIKTERFG